MSRVKNHEELMALSDYEFQIVFFFSQPSCISSLTHLSRRNCHNFDPLVDLRYSGYVDATVQRWALVVDEYLYRPEAMLVMQAIVSI